MRRLYTVETPASIACLGGIQGPLTTPTKMELTDVLAMVKNNYVVYQHNPADLTEKVLVTRRNANSITFEHSRAVAVNRRSLNKLIQEENAPMKVDVIEKHPETTKVTETKKTTKEEKVSKPDTFVMS